MRYRYEVGRWADNAEGINGQSNITSKQDHRIRVRAGAKADIGSGFKVYGQLQYGNDKNGGYGPNSQAVTNGTFNLRQAYVQYDSDFNAGFIAGRQQLNTIWTNNLVGFGAKGYYTGVEGLTLAAFAVDSFEKSGDRIFGSDGTGGVGGIASAGTRVSVNSDGTTDASDFLFRQNFYGAAAVASYDTGFGTIDPQLWLGYLNNRAFFYALDVNYNLPINDSLSWGIRANYLGNSVTGDAKDKFATYSTTGQKTRDNLDNGNFFNVAGMLKGYGFDGTLGGLFYGAKNRFTINTIEDTGAFGLNAGKEILYVTGSNITNSFGYNQFVYANLGYTIDAFRVGGQIVYGGTDTARGKYGDAAKFGGGEKTEYVLEASYNITKKINVQGWYSFLDYDPNMNNIDAQKKNTVLTCLTLGDNS